MNKKQVLIIGVLVLIVLSMLISGCQQQYGTITGKVYPADPNIKVQLIQNLSIVAETNVSEDGTYKFDGLKEGKYGILIIIADKEGFIYNDKINTEWWANNNYQDIEKIYLSTLDSIDLDIFNIWTEDADFFSNELFVTFYNNVSVGTAKDIIEKNSCTIEKEFKRDYPLFLIKTPKDKTFLELWVLLNTNEFVKLVEPHIPSTLS